MTADEISVQHGRDLSGIPWLPSNIAKYFNEHYCTIDISVCKVDAINGYGASIATVLTVLRPFNKCQRCGYHSLFNPDDTESRCLRHTYTKGWDTVFSYSLETGEHKMTLEQAFAEWLDKQPTGLFAPVVPSHY